ncbi:hypothetical protein NLI96_g7730 [Meripilus lineatus]|uniref:DUF6533 domain-containing protein n=1 Tax=Meripilus lineatus TaxID=2056292 RepID=A0AAD5YGW6_9APHY|nr:hypothetical protein NLI96_g7730 [Physisporinus lineatus]
MINKLSGIHTVWVLCALKSPEEEKASLENLSKSLVVDGQRSLPVITSGLIYKGFNQSPSDTTTLDKDIKPAGIMGELETYYSSQQGIKYSRAALLALLVYEILITIDKEVKVVWKYRFTPISLVYLVLRMGTLGCMILYAASSLSILGSLSIIGYVSSTSALLPPFLSPIQMQSSNPSHLRPISDDIASHLHVQWFAGMGTMWGQKTAYYDSALLFCRTILSPSGERDAVRNFLNSHF